MPARKRKKRTDKFTEPYRSVKYLNVIEKDSPATVSVHIQKCLLNSKRYNSGQYIIRINDCGERIELHGVVNSPDSRRNALHKFNTLIDELQKGRDHLESEFKKAGVQY